MGLCGSGHFALYEIVGFPACPHMILSQLAVYGATSWAAGVVPDLLYLPPSYFQIC